MLSQKGDEWCQLLSGEDESQRCCTPVSFRLAAGRQADTHPPPTHRLLFLCRLSLSPTPQTHGYTLSHTHTHSILSSSILREKRYSCFHVTSLSAPPPPPLELFPGYPSGSYRQNAMHTKARPDFTMFSPDLVCNFSSTNTPPSPHNPF